MISAGLLVAALAAAAGTQALQQSVVIGYQQNDVVVTDSTISVTISHSVRPLADRATAWVIVDGTGETPAAASMRLGEKVSAVRDSLARWSKRVVTEAPMLHSIAPYTAQGYTPPAPPASYTARAVLRLTVHQIADMASVEGALIAAGAAPLTAVSFSSSQADSMWQKSAKDALRAADSIAASILSDAGKILGRVYETRIATPSAYQQPTQLPVDSRVSYQGRPAPEVVMMITVTRRYRVEARP